MKSLLALVLLMITTVNYSQENIKNLEDHEFTRSTEGLIKILNMGTFHMSYTPDATTTKFDEHDLNNQLEAKNIAKEIAAFKPTVILIELPPTSNQFIQGQYNDYRNNPHMKFKNPSEIELIAYEAGRIAGTDRIYGIDHRMGYNYKIGEELINTIDSIHYNGFYEHPENTYPMLSVDESTLSLKQMLKGINTDAYLDFLIMVNADMLTHVGTDDNFEGADEAAKYYHRNLRMYSNMNRLDLSPDDRVFILLGASHTAFFRDFISRSPKYMMVNTRDYLK